MRDNNSRATQTIARSSGANECGGKVIITTGKSMTITHSILCVSGIRLIGIILAPLPYRQYSGCSERGQVPCSTNMTTMRHSRNVGALNHLLLPNTRLVLPERCCPYRQFVEIARAHVATAHSVGGIPPQYSPSAHPVDSSCGRPSPRSRKTPAQCPRFGFAGR